LAELDRFRAADHFVEIVEATRQWIEALEGHDGVAGSSLAAVTRMAAIPVFIRSRADSPAAG